jgi:hypothetical protein
MICAAILGSTGQFMVPIHGVISLVQEGAVPYLNRFIMYF